MIINLTKEDKRQIKAVESLYDSQIQEIQTQIDKLLPPHEFDKILKDDDVSLENLDVFEDSISFYQNKYANEDVNILKCVLYLSSKTEKSDKVDALTTSFIKQTQIIDDKEKAVKELLKAFEKREFEKICENSEKIISSAGEQINLLLDNCVDRFTRLIKTGRNKSGDPISAFYSSDLRVSDNGIWIDATAFFQHCKNNLLSLHYNELRKSNDLIDIQKIDDVILNTIANDSRISSDKGVLGEVFFIKKKKKSRSKKIIPTFSEEDLQKFFIFSTTTAKNTIYDILLSDGDVKKTAETINSVSKKNSAQIYIGESNRAIQVETANALTVIEILGNDQRIKSRTAKKILHFIESEIYQHTYYNGQMNDDVVTFPLKKMVDKGLYTSVNNARRAYYNASDILTALRVSVTLKSRKGNKDVSLQDGNGRVVLFPSMIVSNGQCFVRLNEDINWAPLLKDFFLMPDSWWSLPDNASDLEYKIFRSARMKSNKLKKDGTLTFNMSLKSVAAWLNLPLKTKNPKRNVKQPIEVAVNQINESLDPNSFKIKIQTDLKSSIEEYLNGYLEITMGGIYVDNLIDINKKQQALIEKNIKKKEEIVKEASIRKLTETMKTDDA